MSIKSETLW